MNVAIAPKQCSRCECVGARKASIRSWLCAKHYRHQQMRIAAKRQGKTVPTYEELEALSVSMQCARCGDEMHWRLTDSQRESRTKLLTLQHDHSGAFRFMCLSCNTRHQHFEADGFYNVTDNVRRCAACQTMKPLSAFGTCRTGRKWKNKKVYCRLCENAIQQRHRAARRDHYNAYQREWRAKHRSAVTHESWEVIGVR